MTKSSLPAKIKVHLLRLHELPIYEQLQIEEALLRADDRNWCILNSGSSNAIVMGISGKPDKLICPQKLIDQPVPVIRRFSGGGTVFIDPNTVFATWICNTDQVTVCCCPQKIHNWMCDFYKSAFPMFAMHLRENDYVIGERKWGGNAQYLCKNRWLHHTSMLWDYDSKNMQYLLMPEKVPDYRRQRGHDEFLCRLKEHFQESQHVKDSIVKELSARFDVVEVFLNEVNEILKRPHRKATKFV